MSATLKSCTTPALERKVPAVREGL